MATAAQQRATIKYKKNHVKQIVINCYERDLELYAYAREKGKEVNSVSDYIKGLIQADKSKQKQK